MTARTTSSSKRFRLRPLQLERLEDRAVLSADLAFDLAEPASPTVRYHVVLTDAANQILSEVHVGEPFFARLFVTDLRSSPKGVFAGFAALDFDQRGILTSSKVTHGDDFSAFRHASQGALGGMSSSLTPPGNGTSLLAIVPLTATATGEFTFHPMPPLLSIEFDTLLYGRNEPIPLSAIQFTSASLQVRPVPFASGDAPSGLTSSLRGAGFPNSSAPMNQNSVLGTADSSLRGRATDSVSSSLLDRDSAALPSQSRALERDSGEPTGILSRRLNHPWNYLPREFPRQDATPGWQVKPEIAASALTGASVKLHELRGSWDHGLRSLLRVRTENDAEPSARQELSRQLGGQPDSSTRTPLGPRDADSGHAWRMKRVRRDAFLAIGRDSAAEAMQGLQAVGRLGENSSLVDLATAVHEVVWSDLEYRDPDQTAAEQLVHATHDQPAVSPTLTDSLFAAGVEVELRVRPLSKIEWIAPQSTLAEPDEAAATLPVEVSDTLLDSRPPDVTQLPESATVPAA